MTTKTITRRKRCSKCNGLSDTVQGRQRLCESCESEMSYCKICDEYEDRAWGGGCRHVGWHDGMSCGCGTYDVGADDHKESFFVLLKHLAPLKDDDGDPLLPRLAKQIAANNFWTQWHGPMIGGPPDLSLKYKVPGRDD